MAQRLRARADRCPGRDLPRAADDHGPPRAACPELDFGGEHGEQPGEVAAASRREERVHDLPRGRVRTGRRRAQPDPAASSAGQHLGGRGAPAEDRGDRAERDLEHLMEDERHPLRRGEGVHDHVQRNADRVREQGLLLRIDPGALHRLTREHPDGELEWLLAPHPAPAQGIEADPAGHGGEPAAQVLDVPAAGTGQAQPCLLHGVVRVGVRAERAERDRVEIGAMGLEPVGELFFSGHDPSTYHAPKR